MKITAIVEDPFAMVTAVVVDDMTEHVIDPPFPRRDVASIGQHVAELAGYTLDCETLELSPIHAPDANA